MMKKFLSIVGMVLLALPCARAFSLGGPIGNGGDNWQVATIGYGAPYDAQSAPKNIGEGYRRNVPVMYYAYTAAFLDYFGTSGQTNIDLVFTNFLNNAFTDYGQKGLSSYSPGLTEVPLDSMQINYTAQALQFYDIKSMVLALMMPHLGLHYPELDTWLLHDRILPPGGKCPFDEYYTVVQRNYSISPSDFNTIQYSPYVNNTLYSFRIEEACSGGNPLALTETFPVDPSADAYTSVAGGTFSGIPINLALGGYYTGLTSDDIAGLRYLMSTNNVNWETVEGGSLLLDESTNYAAGEVAFPNNANTPQGFGTYSLASLLSFATTNAPAVVATNFPGVVISSSTTFLSVASNAVVSLVLIPPPVGSAYNTAPTVGYVTNYIPYLATNYVTTFANLVTNNLAGTLNPYLKYYARTTNILITVTTAPKTGSAYGSASITTTNYQYLVSTNPSGDYYTVPLAGTNLCGSGIQSLGLSWPIYTTNIILSANTNIQTATNLTTYSVVQYLVSSYLMHEFIAYPVTCAQTANATGLYQGIDKIQFIRVDYDSELGQTFQPVTNSFTMVAVTNSQYRTEHFDRTITAPDILLNAEDLATGAADHPLFGIFYEFEIPSFDQANILPGLAGPGTFNMLPSGAADAQIELTLDKSGDIYENGSLASFSTATNAFLVLGQTTQPIFPLLAYASFDGTTNTPVVYPDGSSIQNLENELIVEVSPDPQEVLTNNVGTVGATFTPVTFTITGGDGTFDLTDPFTWSTSAPPILGGTAPNSGLPPGLSLSPSTGELTGTPSEAGTYDFILTFTDYHSHSVQWPYTIIIQ